MAPHIRTPRGPKIIDGPIPIDGIWIHRIHGSGLSYQLDIRSGPYEFKGNFDKSFRSFTDVVQAAMKFFGIKYGLVTLDPDGMVRATPVRNDQGWRDPI